MAKIPGTLHEIAITRSETQLFNLNVSYRKETIFEKTNLSESEIIEDILIIFEKSNLNIPRNRIERLVRQEIQASSMQKEEFFIEGTVNRVVENIQEKNTESMKKIVLMGLGNAGKTCIYERIFEKKRPWELIHSSATKGIAYKTYKIGSLVSPTIWDLGGQQQYRTEYHTNLKDKIFDKASLLLFILDITDLDRLDEAIAEFSWGAEELFKRNSNAKLFVFMHKVDLIFDKESVFTHIQAKFREKVTSPIRFHATSIFDESLFKAWTEVIREIMPKSSFINAMLSQIKKDQNIEDCLILDKGSGLAVGSTLNEEQERVMIGMVALLTITVDRVLNELHMKTFIEFSLKAVSNNLLLSDITPDIALIVILNKPDLKNEDKERIETSCKILSQQVKAMLV